MEKKIINQKLENLNLYADSKEDNMTNYNSTDLFKEYLHDIRNIKILDKTMINNIRNMSSENKMDIIIAFNDVIENIKIFVE
jgi:hypothetical protein